MSETKRNLAGVSRRWFEVTKDVKDQCEMLLLEGGGVKSIRRSRGNVYMCCVIGAKGLTLFAIALEVPN